MYKYCSKCGHKAIQDANFCSRCGTRLEDVVEVFEEKTENGETNWEQSDFSKEHSESQQYSHSSVLLMNETFIADDFDKISTSCKMYNIEVTSTDGDEIKVSWEKTDSWNLVPQMQGRTLHLKEKYRLGMHNIHDFFHNSARNAIKIEIPRKKKFDLGLENETGSISVLDIEVLDQAEFRTSIGRIEVENLKAPDSVIINTGTGSIRVSDVEAGKTVRLASQIGKVRADKVKTESFFTNSTGGRCTLNDILTSGQFTVTGGVGELLLDSITSQNMDIRMNASGNINCQNLYADSAISIYNTVGNITCGVRDDVVNYTTHCHSDQGENNYPEVSGKGNKKLNVRTTIGSVNVFFTGEKK